MITKDMTVTDILSVDEDIANILMSKGMHCIHCMAAFGESLEQAMQVHGYSAEDVDAIVEQINEFLQEKHTA